MLGGAVNGRPFASSGSGQLGQPARLLLALFTRECLKSAAPSGASVCRSHQMGLRTGVRHCCSLRSSLPISVSLPRQYFPGPGEAVLSACRQHEESCQGAIRVGEPGTARARVRVLGMMRGHSPPKSTRNVCFLSLIDIHAGQFTTAVFYASYPSRRLALAIPRCRNARSSCSRRGSGAPGHHPSPHSPS